ncbi:hypothetical protein PQX77_011392 [Marasmius sp. AFHP31]|nr:hypothetical protein PQX77_011392 [Marasmius sp. AFHP31]
MRSSQLILTILAAALTASAAPGFSTLEARDVIGHDKVKGFKETVPDNEMGKAMLKFQPFLKVDHGCVPFPAVDKDGNTGGGLKPTGSHNGKCSKSPGQVYARAKEHNKKYAIMYSWYFPKDNPSPGIGHRHDWESAVVWLDNLKSQKIVGVATSAHGDFDKVTKNFKLEGSRPKIRYFMSGTHQLGTTDVKGGEQPLVAWDSLPDAARKALSDTDFGDANVYIKDANFEDRLGQADFD